MACPLGGYFCIVHFFYCLFACLSYLSAGTHYDRLRSDGRSTSALVYIKSPWVRGRRRGHHPAPRRMPLNKRSFFLAATAIELALLLGYGRSQYTGNCTNVINTTAPSKRRTHVNVIDLERRIKSATTS